MFLILGGCAYPYTAQNKFKRTLSYFPVNEILVWHKGKEYKITKPHEVRFAVDALTNINSSVENAAPGFVSQCTDLVFVQNGNAYASGIGFTKSQAKKWLGQPFTKWLFGTILKRGNGKVMTFNTFHKMVWAYRSTDELTN